MVPQVLQGSLGCPPRAGRRGEGPEGAGQRGGRETDSGLQPGLGPATSVLQVEARGVWEQDFGGLQGAAASPRNSHSK